MQSKFNHLPNILVQNRDYKKSEIESVISMPYSKWQDFFHQSNIAYVRNIDPKLPSSTPSLSAFQIVLFAIALPLSIAFALDACTAFANVFTAGSLISVTTCILGLGTSYCFGNIAIDLGIKIYESINPNSTAFHETFSGEEIVTFYNKISHGMRYTEAESLLYHHNFSAEDLKDAHSYHDGDIAVLIPSKSLEYQLLLIPPLEISYANEQMIA